MHTHSMDQSRNRKGVCFGCFYCAAVRCTYQPWQAVVTRVPEAYLRNLQLLMGQEHMPYIPGRMLIVSVYIETRVSHYNPSN